MACRTILQLTNDAGVAAGCEYHVIVQHNQFPVEMVTEYRFGTIAPKSWASKLRGRTFDEVFSSNQSCPIFLKLLRSVAPYSN